ncbi:AmmeMemoRadiSam system radical SAM enzyme [Sulfuricurvum sp. UBA5598]|nr:AmmeMemoRadiSam system radical SAM enzyme [Sulfuricurvum sp. UBA5598]
MEYFITKGDRITCVLCRHYCTLSEGQIGMCHVEKNVGGNLECLVYGHPVAVHVDPIEKKPLFHFLPRSFSFSLGTVGCNLRCPFCQNWQISQCGEIDTSYTLLPADAARIAQERGCASISYTYNEPAVWYPYAKDIGLEAKKRGLRNVFVSSGFESEEVSEDLPSWLDATNIDLKSYDSGYYKKTLKASLEGVQETLKAMVRLGIWVEVTTLIVPGHNDKEHELKGIAKFIAEELGPHVPWHISAFHPDYKMLDTRSTPISLMEQAYTWGKEAGLYYVYLGNVSLPSQTRCPQCDTLLIERYGFETTHFALDAGHCPQCHRKIEGVWQ